MTVWMEDPVRIGLLAETAMTASTEMMESTALVVAMAMIKSVEATTPIHRWW